MALTQEYIAAVSQENVLRVKIMLKDSLLIDTSFNQFNEMILYAERKSLGIWISDSEDNEVFSNSPDDLNVILAGLVDNFSRRRVEHLKGMISSIYPPKAKIGTEKHEQETVKRRTKSLDDEYKGIKANKRAIDNVLSNIKRHKQMISENMVKKKRMVSDIVDIVRRRDEISGK